VNEHEYGPIHIWLTTNIT